MSSDGMQPPDSGEKRLGDIVGDISGKAQQLVQEEIELAKAEIQQKLTGIGKGAAAGAAAGVFLVLMLIYLLHSLAWLFNDLFNQEGNVWFGFAIVAGLLLLLAIVAGLLALRFIKKGSPPVPELAIQEAKATRESLEEVRH